MPMGDRFGFELFGEAGHEPLVCGVVGEVDRLVRVRPAVLQDHVVVAHEGVDAARSVRRERREVRPNV